MKYSKIFYLLFLISTEYAAQNCTAEVILTSNLENTIYFLDGKRTGKGKEVSTELNPGSYELKLIEGMKTWNPQVQFDTLHLGSCSRYAFTYQFSSQTLMRSDPMDAYVYINDSLAGNTPLMINNVSGSVTLKKSGYARLDKHIKDIHEVLRMQKTETKNGRSFYKQDLFKYLLGGLVILGGATAYFKLKADDIYEEYELTGENKLLDETRKYDLISGITFGALQVNFGVLLYYFLSE